MKFGKLQDISTVNFALPTDAANTKSILAALSPNISPTLYVGCTGWSMKEWVGHVYPSNAKTKDYLTHYAKQFNTIELNTTHYRIPTIETIQKWRTTATTDFRFCPKIPQAISHSSGMGLNDGKLRAFCESIQQLAEKLGCCFMQMPPYFDTSRLAVLATFLEEMPTSIPLAIEIRHESWFRTENHLLPLVALAKAKNCALVITDVAGRRDVLHQQLTNNIAIIRFVGNDLHPTDYTRIDEWVQRLKNWFAQGVSEVYFFTHEPDNIKAPELAKYLVEQAKALMPEVKTRGPEFIKEQGQQMSLF